MKRIIILLLISLWIAIPSFSQTTYPIITKDSLVLITPAQLKTTNLIFNEHKTLKLLCTNYKSQINSYKKVINTYQLTDSIQKKAIYDYDILNQQINKDLQKEKRNKKIYKGLMIGGVSVGIIGILVAILK